MEHKDLVREEFTRQANDYATAPAILDAEHLRKLVEIVAPPADARVLEVATGPGHVAMAFAAVCREVVGIDLTDAPLKIAEKMRMERGLTNVQLSERRRRVAPAVQGRRIRRRRLPVRDSSFRFSRESYFRDGACVPRRRTGSD